MSLIEMVLSISAFLTVMLGFSRVLATTTKASGTNFETVVAREAARSFLETLQAEDFDTVFARYNLDEQDDPEGPGTAPGGTFVVDGLRVRSDDPDGRVGTISFPTKSGAPGVLREDLVLPAFGLPADLDGDGDIDDGDKSDTCRFLPVRIVLEWESGSGPATLEMRTLLADSR